MTCQEYFDTIGLMLDNELAFDKQASLFAHLSVCDVCRDNFDIMLRVRSVMRSDTPEFPADLDARILGNIPTQEISIALPPGSLLAAKVPIRARSLHLPLPLAAAVAILALALGLVAGRSLLSRPDQPVPTSATLVTQPAVEIIYAVPGVEVTATAVSADSLGPR